jgi:hypothetical protein
MHNINTYTNKHLYKNEGGKMEKKVVKKRVCVIESIIDTKTMMGDISGG